MKSNILKIIELGAALALGAATANAAPSKDPDAQPSATGAQAQDYSQNYENKAPASGQAGQSSDDLRGQQRWWNSDSWEASHPAYQQDVARNKWDYSIVWKEHAWRQNRAGHSAENANWNDQNRANNAWHDTWDYNQNDTGWQSTW